MEPEHQARRIVDCSMHAHRTCVAGHHFVLPVLYFAFRIAPGHLCIDTVLADSLQDGHGAWHMYRQDNAINNSIADECKMAHPPPHILLVHPLPFTSFICCSQVFKT